MDRSIITVLAIILLIFILLNHITINIEKSPSNQSNCSETSFGCCPNGVDSKINYYGTNCPGYRPAPGYYVNPTDISPNRNPIGGCAGTRYGCCPNNTTSKVDQQGSNCI
jgi:hypothetical protein